MSPDKCESIVRRLRPEWFESNPHGPGFIVLWGGYVACRLAQSGIHVWALNFLLFAILRLPLIRAVEYRKFMECRLLGAIYCLRSWDCRPEPQQWLIDQRPFIFPEYFTALSDVEWDLAQRILRQGRDPWRAVRGFKALLQPSANNSDSYVKHLLTNGMDLSTNEIPLELVELKRAQLKLHRLMKGTKQ